jgi:hypothetical protein
MNPEDDDGRGPELSESKPSPRLLEGERGAAAVD